MLSGRVVGLSGLSGRVESGFQVEESNPQPDPIRNRVIGFGLISGRVYRVGLVGLSGHLLFCSISISCLM